MSYIDGEVVEILPNDGTIVVGSIPVAVIGIQTDVKVTRLSDF